MARANDERTLRISSLTGIACFFTCDRLVQDAMMAQDVALYNSCLLLGLVVVFALVGVYITAKRTEWMPSRSACFGLGLCSAIAAVLLVFADGCEIRVALVCALLACQMFMLPVWAVSFCCVDSRWALVVVTLSFLVSMACVAAGRVFPIAIPWLMASTGLIAGICAGLLACNHIGSKLDPEKLRNDEAFRVSSASMVFSFVGVFVPCCLIAQFFTGLVLQPFVISSSHITFLFALIVSLLSVVFLVWGRLVQKLDVGALFFVPFVILIIGLVLFSTSILKSPIIPVSLVVAASTCLCGLSWMAMRDLVVAEGRPCIPTFAKGALFCEGMLGMCMGVAVNKLVSVNYSTVTSIAIASIAVFALFYVFGTRMHTRTLKIASRQVIEANQHAAQAAEEAALATEEAATAIQNAEKLLERAERLASVQVDEAWQFHIDKQAEKYHLTPREREVATLVVKGLSNSDIAESLFVSTSAVKFHLKNIFTKCGVHSRSELTDLFHIV